MTLQKIKKNIIFIISVVLLPLLLFGCKGDKTPLPPATVSPTDKATPTPKISADISSSVSFFNPLYDFYSSYNNFSEKQLDEYIITLEETDEKTLIKLSEHLFYTTLPMNTVGLLISSGDDFYGDLFDGFDGSGEILTYDDRYEFSYDFSSLERLWGTLKQNELTFYKSFKDSEDYFKMTLTKTNDGYISTCRTFDGTTVLTITADSISFE